LLFFLCGGIGHAGYPAYPMYSNVLPYSDKHDHCENVSPYAVAPYSGVGPYSGGCYPILIIIILLILVGGFGRNKRRF